MSEVEELLRQKEKKYGEFVVLDILPAPSLKRHPLSCSAPHFILTGV